MKKPRGKSSEQFEKALNFARYARIWFEKGDMETRRAIFAASGSHLIIKDRKLNNIELHPYFKVIFENHGAVERELIKVRTSESASNKRQIAEILAMCPILRSVVDNIRTEIRNNRQYLRI